VHPFPPCTEPPPKLTEDVAHSYPWYPHTHVVLHDADVGHKPNTAAIAHDSVKRTSSVFPSLEQRN
jgi:hypothetical protein